MTTLAPTHSEPRAPRMSWFSRAEAWLDARGTGAWIAAMVLGFIFFWPIGLALVIYMTATNKWSCWGRSSRKPMMATAARAMKTSGNSAFDAYKAETLRRLEDEQESFEAFLERLRAAKDKAEFDEFMDERAKAAKSDEEGDADKGDDTKH
ncbi:MAG: DUF2852 domain-containing protein [Pseudomonadota bacterium]